MMKGNASVRSGLFLAVAIALSFSVQSAYSAALGDDQEDLRYDFFKAADGKYRFDKKTGEIERLERDDSGVFHWIRVAVPSNKDNGEPAAAPKVVKSAPPIHDDNGFAIPNEQHKKPTKITLEDDKGNDITDNISDFDRKNAAADIAAYLDKLSYPAAIRMGERVTGTILLRNIGTKKLKQLEVSVVIPVFGKDAPEIKRYVYMDKAGSTAPPQPGAPPLRQDVDFPAPPGSGKAGPETTITYIKFAD